MVESSSEALSFQTLVVGNPTVARGHRTSMIYSDKRPNLLVYAIKDNLVFRNMANPSESKVYGDHRARITSVAEQKTGSRFAFGDEKGMVTVITYRESGEITMDKQYQLLAGEVRQVIWSQDGTRLIAVGTGTEVRANAITFDTGSKCGTILGFTFDQLCSDLA